MNAVERRLQFLEDEVRKLRRRVRNGETQDQVTLEAPLIAQSVAGENRDIVVGYDGPIYDPDTDVNGLVYGDDSTTRFYSQVVDSTNTATMGMVATRYSGALAYPSQVYVQSSSDGNSNKVVLSTHTTWTFTGEELSMPASSHIALGTSASDPSSPADGWLFYRTDTDVVRLRANGAWVNLATTDDLSRYTRVYYKDNNGTSGRGPAATTSETSLGSFTVTGGDMGTTSILRVRLMGTYTGSGASTTVTLRIKFGSTTMYADASAAFTAAGQPWFAEIHLANVGSASAQRGGGFILMGGGTATTGVGDLATDEIRANTPVYINAAEDTSTDKTFEVTAQLSDGTSPNSFLCLSMVAELL